ncbi:hypothetical protein [Acinetobacter johnsonii]|uniref:hypothetical protein n=1 Tax=Acinetobacter johnsonii TaxID=40214 RepID=UPI000B214DD3|nr:hypothetical protein [Acinetobacter johnsonii]
MTEEEIKEKIENTISIKIKKTQRPIILQRLEYIRSKKPDEIAIGSAGYQGYVVYNFYKLGMYESNRVSSYSSLISLIYINSSI